jgi:hypothetical protein
MLGQMTGVERRSRMKVVWFLVGALLLVVGLG